MKPRQPIRILLAEDHNIVRQGLGSLLRTDGGFDIVGEARTGREAVQLALSLIPEIILMDIAMPVLNGLDATRQILAKEPAIRIVVLSAHSDDCYLERLSAAGVSGYMIKQSSAETLTKALREVMAGRFCISPSLARRHRELNKPSLTRSGEQVKSKVRLTDRETEVLQLIAEGSPNKQTADTLGISIKTVEKHRQSLMDKLSIHDTAGLTRYAMASGIIEQNVQLNIV